MTKRGVNVNIKTRKTNNNWQKKQRKALAGETDVISITRKDNEKYMGFAEVCKKSMYHAETTPGRIGANRVMNLWGGSCQGEADHFGGCGRCTVFVLPFTMRSRGAKMPLCSKFSTPFRKWQTECISPQSNPRTYPPSVHFWWWILWVIYKKALSRVQNIDSYKSVEISKWFFVIQITLDPLSYNPSAHRFGRLW